MKRRIVAACENNAMIFFFFFPCHESDLLLKPATRSWECSTSVRVLNNRAVGGRQQSHSLVDIVKWYTLTSTIFTLAGFCRHTY